MNIIDTNKDAFINRAYHLVATRWPPGWLTSPIVPQTCATSGLLSPCSCNGNSRLTLCIFYSCRDEWNHFMVHNCDEMYRILVCYITSYCFWLLQSQFFLAASESTYCRMTLAVEIWCDGSPITRMTDQSAILDWYYVHTRSPVTKRDGPVRIL